MNYKNVEKIVNRIAINYLSSTDNHAQYFNLVNESFSKLSFVSQQIINNEFFFNDYPFWWEKYYSKKQFIKLKKKAMNQFLYSLKALYA